MIVYRGLVGIGGRFEQVLEADGGGRAAAGKGLGRVGWGENAVKDHAVVAVVGGVAVTVPVPGVQVELHVPADQALTFPEDEGVPEVRAGLGAGSAWIEDLDPSAFRGPEVLLADGPLPPEAGEESLGHLLAQILSAGGPGWGFGRHFDILHGNV